MAIKSFEKIYSYFLYRLRAFFNNACPFDVLPPIGTNPLIPNALRAAFTAFANLATFLYAFFPCACAFFDTTLPCLFLTNELFFNPPDVFSLDPRNTRALAPRPFAILLTRFFIAFFFMPDFFAFMAFMAFIAFIDFFIDFAMIINLKFLVKSLLE